MRHSLFFNIFKHFNISDAGHFTHQCNNEFVWGRRLKFVKIKKKIKNHDTIIIVTQLHIHL